MRRSILLPFAFLILAAMPARADDTPPVVRLRVPIEGAPSHGAAQPLVRIVEFSDFQCPFCGRVVPAIDRLIREFPNEVRVYFRHNPLPFHTSAMPAAEAAVEAQRQGGDARFWRLHDMLFSNQQALDRQNLDHYAIEAGLDMNRFARALDAGTNRTRIQADQALAQRLGANGTPTFFVNGREVTGAQPYETFAEVVRNEIDRARAMMRTGVGRADLYARLMRDARETPPPQVQRPYTPPPAAPVVQRRVPVGGSPQLGPDDALVTLVLFSDFQCPFCARLEPTIAQLRDQYGNDLRVVWKHSPLDFHTNAMPAAEATAEAFAQGGNPTFWALHDRLFANSPNLARADLERAAAEVGLDMGRFIAALDAHSHRDEIERDRTLAQSLGAQGTPIAFVNGWMIRGAQPIETFRTTIDRELAAARERVARGTPRYRVYETILAETPAEPPQAQAAP